jgi:hypothetical protein
MLGADWEQLPDALLYVHTPPRLLEGLVTIDRGDGFLSRLVGRFLRLPNAGERLLMMVRMTVENDGELWERWVQGRRFASRLSPGGGFFRGLLVEQFGAIAVGLTLIWRGGRLEFKPRRWTLLGLPMPDVFAPTGVSFECQINEDFCFDIEIAHPALGLLIRYRGFLRPSA